MQQAVQDISDYSGKSNLEVMENARNYNGYLTKLIASYAPASKSILDFGAGSGLFARSMAAIGLTPACVEPDDELRGSLKKTGFETFADVEQVAIASVDYIYSLNVLEHIEDDLAALKILRQKLRLNGTLLIYVPAFQVLYSSMDRAVGHHRRYRRAQLVHLMKLAGFEVRRACYCDSLGFLASLAFKMLGSDDGSINQSSLILYDRVAFPVSRVLDLVSSRLFGKNLLVVGSRAT